MIIRNNDGNWDDNHDSGVNGISDEDDAVPNRLLSSARYANFIFCTNTNFATKNITL